MLILVWLVCSSPISNLISNIFPRHALHRPVFPCPGKSQKESCKRQRQIQSQKESEGKRQRKKWPRLRKRVCKQWKKKNKRKRDEEDDEQQGKEASEDVKMEED